MATPGTSKSQTVPPPQIAADVLIFNFDFIICWCYPQIYDMHHGHLNDDSIYPLLWMQRDDTRLDCWVWMAVDRLWGLLAASSSIDPCEGMDGLVSSPNWLIITKSWTRIRTVTISVWRGHGSLPVSGLSIISCCTHFRWKCGLTLKAIGDKLLLQFFVSSFLPLQLLPKGQPNVIFEIPWCFVANI